MIRFLFVFLQREAEIGSVFMIFVFVGLSGLGVSE